MFAGTMLAILAVVNLIDGIAAVSDSTFFVGDAKFVVSDLNTWGWILIAMSAVQFFVVFGIWAQIRAVRWIGVAIAAVNAIAQLIMMPAYPFWSLCLFTLDILVIYGLIAHGRGAPRDAQAGGASPPWSARKIRVALTRRLKSSALVSPSLRKIALMCFSTARLVRKAAPR